VQRIVASLPRMATPADPTARKVFSSGRGSAFGSVAPILEGMWWAWGTTRFMPGATFPRNMTIIREDDALVVVHPVMLPERQQAELDALGKVEHIVRLGDFHGMDDARYQERYGAQLWAPRGAVHHEGTRVDHELVAGGETPFAGGSLHGFAGARSPELVLHLPRHGGVLHTCDSVQNWERSPPGISLLGRLMAKMIGFGGRACVGPPWRRACEPKDGPHFGPSFRALLELDFRHLLSAHGPPILDTAKQDLRTSVERLYPA
jgi:hypothetical protein